MISSFTSKTVVGTVSGNRALHDLQPSLRNLEIRVFDTKSSNARSKELSLSKTHTASFNVLSVVAVKPVERGSRWLLPIPQ